MSLEQKFPTIFRKGKFISKAKIDVGDFVEFVYEGELKYVFVLNPNWDGHVHGVTIVDYDHDQLLTLIKAYLQGSDAKGLYESIKSLVSSTRTYRKYNISKISRARAVQYVEKIG